MLEEMLAKCSARFLLSVAVPRILLDTMNIVAASGVAGCAAAIGKESGKPHLLEIKIILVVASFPFFRRWRHFDAFEIGTVFIDRNRVLRRTRPSSKAATGFAEA
jgi:hypothetical protein